MCAHPSPIADPSAVFRFTATGISLKPRTTIMSSAELPSSTGYTTGLNSITTAVRVSGSTCQQTIIAIFFESWK